jgi:CHAT domain-containing protein
MELAHQIFSVPSERSKQTAEIQKHSLDKLRERCEKLERDLARQVPEVRLRREIRAVDQRKVASRLPKGSVLVDFVRFTPRRFGAARGESRYEAPRYLAFILHAGKLEVQMIDLGEAEHIEAAIAMFRRCVIWPTCDLLGETLEENRKHLLRLCRQLYCNVFLPIKETLKEGHSNLLFLSPDGELNLLPFEALLNEEGKFVIEEYRLNYVASGRDVLRFGQKLGEPTHQALIIADPDFNLFIEGVIAQSEAKVFSLEEYLAEGEPRLSQDFHKDVAPFKRLPGAYEEGKKVAELLRGENVSVCTWFDRKALDGPFKTVRAPRILHLATHGFFEEDQEMKQGDVIQSRGNERSFLPSGIENPLLRSGLVLAGVNTFLQKGQLMPEAEDGILTALDVCGLNLYGTELVTLSACDTGVGEVHRGEGVFGLRRAFHQAGARTLVMSLWQVEDEVTWILMEHFYQNLLSGLPKPDALRQAQLCIIRKMREGNLQSEYDFPHPFFWAAFVFQGDPAPLRIGKTGH